MIESVIYKALKNIEDVAENTASYHHQPAVFFQQLPDDKDCNWDSSYMYPRIIYDVNWRCNSERKTDGEMAVDIFCTNESKTMPEELSQSIVSNLSNLFLTDESGTYCLLWDRTDSFDIEGKEPLVCGVSIAFDIVFYPKQEGAVPCPIWSVNQFIKARYPQCTLVGHDTVSEFLKASKECPVIYARKTDTKNIKTSYAMAWMQTDVNISVISDSVENTRAWVNDIVRDLSIEQETVMQNGSPYLIMSIAEVSTNEPVKTGQIVLSGQYGIMRKAEESVKLNNIYFEK